MSVNNVFEEAQARPFLFDLLPFFAADVLDFSNQNYCVFNPNAHAPYMVDVKYIPFNNPYIENEFKGFIQHLALDCHFTASTIYGYILANSRTIAKFTNQYHQDITSITDVEYEKIYPEFLEFLSDNGYTITTQSVHRIASDMTVHLYPCKTQHVSGFTTFYKYIFSQLYPSDGREYDRDVWDIRKLGIPYSTADSRKRYTVNYSFIKQEWLKASLKEYNYYRIQNRTMSAVLDDMKALNIFSAFLDEHYPALKNADELNRQIIEEYYSYLSLKGFVSTTYNRRISAIRTFFSIGNMLDIEGIPSKPLIFDSDYRKITHPLPKYFSDNELTQMNEHIADLPPQIGRMFFVLENCGMRVSDICSTEIAPDGRYCLKENGDGEYVFTYFMPKSHRFNTIPVSGVVAAVIEEAINSSRETYGKDCRFIFAKSKDAPISTDVFNDQMNRMSLKCHLKRDDGSPLRITGHTFRGTVATNYANCGLSMDVIRMMLGQQKVGVLNHYVTIHGAAMIDYLKPINDENEYLIKNIGKLDELQYEHVLEPALIPLPNGRCSKPVESGICTKADMCYSCRMFKPDVSCMNIYKAQLQEARNNIAVAEMHGYERILEKNKEIAERLTKIIRKLEKENACL